jgi:uncharacterized protein (DUF427 family)
MQAIWSDKIIAESDKTMVIEGNHYFPPDSVERGFLKNSDRRSTCPWKGQAYYYTLVVNGKVNPDAAWYYPEPKEAAKEITNYVAFWQGWK